MAYADTQFMHTTPFVFSLRYTVSRRAHKGVASVMADCVVLNCAILVLPRFMLFTIQAKSTPK